MLISNLTTLHVWGRVLAKFQEVRTITYEDDGYMKTNMRVTIQVLTELKSVLKEDAGLDLNVSKTSVLPKGVTQLFCRQLFFRWPLHRVRRGRFNNTVSTLIVVTPIPTH
jgi:hypothetical protein